MLGWPEPGMGVISAMRETITGFLRDPLSALADLASKRWYLSGVVVVMCILGIATNVFDFAKHEVFTALHVLILNWNHWMGLFGKLVSSFLPFQYTITDDQMNVFTLSVVTFHGSYRHMIVHYPRGNAFKYYFRLEGKSVFGKIFTLYLFAALFMMPFINTFAFGLSRSSFNYFIYRY